jgi:hypothetical protein
MRKDDFKLCDLYNEMYNSEEQYKQLEESIFQTAKEKLGSLMGKFSKTSEEKENEAILKALENASQELKKYGFDVSKFINLDTVEKFKQSISNQEKTLEPEVKQEPETKTQIPSDWGGPSKSLNILSPSGEKTTTNKPSVPQPTPSSKRFSTDAWRKQQEKEGNWIPDLEEYFAKKDTSDKKTQEDSKLEAYKKIASSETATPKRFRARAYLNGLARKKGESLPFPDMVPKKPTITPKNKPSKKVNTKKTK